MRRWVQSEERRDRGTAIETSHANYKIAHGREEVPRHRPCVDRPLKPGVVATEGRSIQ
jgi:hypothetical protein